MALVDQAVLAEGLPEALAAASLVEGARAAKAVPVGQAVLVGGDSAEAVRAKELRAPLRKPSLRNSRAYA